MFLDRTDANQFRAGNFLGGIESAFQDQLNRIVTPPQPAQPEPTPTFDIPASAPALIPTTAASTPIPVVADRQDRIDQPTHSASIDAMHADFQQKLNEITGGAQTNPVAAPSVAPGAPVTAPLVAPATSATVSPIAPVTAPLSNPTSPMQPLPSSAGPAARTSQFQLGLSDADAYAACGPAAAIAFAKTYGRNPTAQEALNMAREAGWTPQAGMAGIASEQKLLSSIGVATKLEQGSGFSWDHVAADASAGNPVILDSGGHYFYVEGYDPKTGKFNVGTSGTDLKGGSQWATKDEINQMALRLPGGTSIRGALYADNPSSPVPSIAARNVPSSTAPATPAPGVTLTTAGLSGGGRSDSSDPNNLLGYATKAASWLGDPRSEGSPVGSRNRRRHDGPAWR